jgi:carboxypeptidase T
VVTSADPCSEIYRGPRAESEPETANVTWPLNQSPTVSYFIDVHSFGEDILYNWGDDDDQTTDPSMNFRNPEFDGKRGIPDSTPGGDSEKYREYVPADDLDDLVGLGNVMRDAIRAADGREYSVKGAVGLYPTSDTSDDYAYSRSFLDARKRKVRGYTIEWGPERSSIPKSFHPDYSDMLPIIEEVTAALFAFCAEVAGRIADPRPAKRLLAAARPYETAGGSSQR